MPVHVNRRRAGAAGILGGDFANAALGEVVVLAVHDRITRIRPDVDDGSC